MTFYQIKKNILIGARLLPAKMNYYKAWSSVNMYNCMELGVYHTLFITVMNNSKKFRLKPTSSWNKHIFALLMLCDQANIAQPAHLTSGF